MISSIVLPGWNTARTPLVSSDRLLVVGNDAADDDAHVAEAGVAQRRPSASARSGGRWPSERDADDVDVLLERELDDGGDRLPRRRVDHLHAGVAQAAATMRLPRSWPSSPILVTSTRAGGDRAAAVICGPARP